MCLGVGGAWHHIVSAGSFHHQQTTAETTTSGANTRAANEPSRSFKLHYHGAPTIGPSPDAKAKPALTVNPW